MKKRKAFTLVELLIVVGIICIVTAVMVPVIVGVMDKSKDQSDEVSAGLYTSVMQQFANEKAGQALLYPALTTTGADAEYALLSQKSGHGMFPGYNILVENNTDSQYDAIRREAVIAIKAFSKVKTLDGYYVEPPAKEHFHYVYYYLTGQVTIEDERTKAPVSSVDVKNGVINVEDYWVYLSRDGGSGDAIDNSTNGTGMVFIQIRQYGTDKLLEDTTVRLRIGSEIRTAKTGTNGTVGFTDIQKGTVFVEAEKLGAISFPNNTFYTENGCITVKENGYVGESAANPYVITLKMGSLGSLGFYRRTNTWNGYSWNSTDDYITDNVDFTSAFRIDTGRDTGIARDETYYTNARSSAGRQELLTTDGKFLLYGPYNLTVSGTNYRNYTEAVVSRVYGIDNYKNGGTGEYANASSPYEYPIIMRRPSGKGQVTGTVTYECSTQPLVGTPSISGTWVTGEENYSVKTRVVMENKNTGNKYYSSYLSTSSTGKHNYSISNLPDGEYKIYLESPYGSNNYFDLSEFPTSVKIDGSEMIINATAKIGDVDYGKPKVTVTYDSKGNNDPISGATVQFVRCGTTTYAAKTTDDDGIVSFLSIKRGFYNIKITAPGYINGSEYIYKIFVDGDEDITIRLPIDTITITGTISGYKPDKNPMDIKGSFDGLKLSFKRFNEDGTKEYSAVSATCVTTELKATYSVTLVPGMYKISTSVTCYRGYANAETLNNLKAAKAFDFSLNVDDDTRSCHPSAKFSWFQDDTYHWEKCSKCGTVFNKSKHTPSKWTASGATGCYRYCTETNCKRTLDPVTAHDYKHKTTGSYEATCVKNGNKHSECSRCSYAKDESLPLTGHNFGAWTSDDASTHSRKCKNAGCNKTETANHSFNSWYWTDHTIRMTDNGSGCYHNGTQRSDCTTCGYYKLNSPIVGHSIECYMVREYVNDSTYYNYPTNYSEAFFVTPDGRTVLQLGSSSNYSGRQVWAPAGATSGDYGLSYKVTSKSSSSFTKSAIFSNTKSSHFTACANRPSINGVAYYCHAPINHEGNPLRDSNYCGCKNKPLGYILLSNGAEIKPNVNPAWDDPYRKYGRR